MKHALFLIRATFSQINTTWDLIGKYKLKNTDRIAEATTSDGNLQVNVVRHPEGRNRIEKIVNRASHRGDDPVLISRVEEDGKEEDAVWRRGGVQDRGWWRRD